MFMTNITGEEALIILKETEPSCTTEFEVTWLQKSYKGILKHSSAAEEDSAPVPIRRGKGAKRRKGPNLPPRKSISAYNIFQQKERPAMVRELGSLEV